MDVAKVDVRLLRTQRWFLEQYPWRESTMPSEVEGLVNLLDYMIDEMEGTHWPKSEIETAYVMIRAEGGK